MQFTVDKTAQAVQIGTLCSMLNAILFCLHSAHNVVRHTTCKTDTISFQRMLPGRVIIGVLSDPCNIYNPIEWCSRDITDWQMVPLQIDGLPSSMLSDCPKRQDRCRWSSPHNSCNRTILVRQPMTSVTPPSVGWTPSRDLDVKQIGLSPWRN